MKFGKSLIATAFIGYAASVKIGGEYDDSDAYSDETITRAAFFDLVERVRVNRESYTPLFKKAARFCYDNFEDNYDFCIDNVWNQREYYDFMALGEYRME